MREISGLAKFGYFCVGLFGGLVDGGDLEAGLFGLLPGRRAFAQADAHVAPRVPEVERMGVPLAPVTDDGHLAALDDPGVDVLLVIAGDGHG